MKAVLRKGRRLFLWHIASGLPQYLFGQQSLLERRESIERIQGSHGKEIHLADLFKHGMWRRQCGIQLRWPLDICNWT